MLIARTQEDGIVLACHLWVFCKMLKLPPMAYCDAMAKKDDLIIQARKHLDASEKVVAAVQGNYEAKVLGSDVVRAGVLIATEQRVVFYAKKIGGFDFESFPIEKISSVEQSKSMMGHTVTFFASGNRVSMKWIKSSEDVTAFVRQVQTRTQPPSAAPQSGSSTSIPDQIKALAELHSAGVLNDDEFERKKTDLLNRM